MSTKEHNNDIALLINQDSKRVPARMRTLHRLAKQYDVKMRLCDGSDLDYEIRLLLKQRNLKRIIIGGGDGTVATAASLIMRKRPKIELAVLPLGTANYYAKSLGLPKNIIKSFEIAFADNLEERHLCRVNKRDFLIGVNVGTASRMFNEVTDDEKKKYGRLAYFGGIARVLTNLKSTNLEIKANGKTRHYKFTELVVLNQKIEEKIKLTPDVKGSDPYFEIITYGVGNSLFSPLIGIVIFALTFGRNQKYLKRIRTTKATISSSSNLPVAVDGDVLESLPLKISLNKKPIKFVRT